MILIYHFDIDKSAFATKLHDQLQRAYDVLGNPEKRNTYDQQHDAKIIESSAYYADLGKPLKKDVDTKEILRKKTGKEKPTIVYRTLIHIVVFIITGILFYMDRPGQFRSMIRFLKSMCF